MAAGCLYHTRVRFHRDCDRLLVLSTPGTIAALFRISPNGITRWFNYPHNSVADFGTPSHFKHPRQHFQFRVEFSVSRKWLFGDRVSTMASGLWDQAKHALFSKSASGSFRSCFIASIIALLLHNLAPGTLTISTPFIFVPTTLSIGMFAADSNYLPESTNPYPRDRATAIVRLEQAEDSGFAYSMSPGNCVIGWPNSAYLQNGSTLRYASDSACGSHQCVWDIPKLAQDGNADLAFSVWNTTTVQPQMQWEVEMFSTTNSTRSVAPGRPVLLRRFLKAHAHSFF